MAEPAGAGASGTGASGPADGGRDLPGTGRTEAFSDGAFAIVITLLVLDLVSPAYRTGDLGAALLREWPAYLAFAVSFVYIGVIWLNHHALFRHVGRMSPGFSWINLGVLFGAVIIPFPTVVIARPVTGIGLYAASGLVGWLASPVAGLALIIIMILYHAITSEGLYEGPLGRLIRHPGGPDD